MRGRWRPILALIVVVLLVVVGAGDLWLTNLVLPVPETEAAMVSSDAHTPDAVSVESDRWLTFAPAEASTTGFIFYPGGRVPA